ncbi:MAG: hypothetical protein KJO95_03660 [Gammaproteobacteria bacterium]|nr:hypothetical protein [Gammaproteobacteria bacterium]MBU2676948.1 hypothetical protein [Gammaproteobacteria bacterium]NNC56765.1 hypothetical protein [Woeseiaceae bacterium]NNL50681.1 hypothetical protein [Woeseiaceae bacterium]
MAKRNFVALMLAGVGALAISSNARTEEAFIGVDGCAVLAQLVYAEVTADAWYGPRDVLSWADAPVENAITICNQTARTVSKAYTSAMNSVGAPIDWGYPSLDPGDVCLSGFLEQCYPDRYPIDALAGTWNAVSRTVQQAMPNGSGSDQSIFSTAAMRLALRSALRQQDRNN